MSRNRIILLILIILFIVSIVRYFSEVGTALSTYSLSLTVGSAFLVTILSFFVEDKKEFPNKLIRIAPIFIIGYVAVHFFAYLAYTLSYIDYIVALNFIDIHIINEAAIFSLICLEAFVLGYIATKKGFKKRKSMQCRVKNELDYLALFFLVLFYVTMDKRYFQSGGNFELVNKEGGISIITILSQVLLMASLIGSALCKIYRNNINSFSQYARSFSKTYYFTLLVYFALVILSGDRGPLLQVGFSFFAVYYFISRKKIKLKIIIPASLIIVFGLNILGNLRGIDGELNMKKITNANAMFSDNIANENIIFSSTRELWIVVRAYNVIYNETKKNGTTEGIGLIDQFLGVIPGLRPLIIYPIFGESEKIISTNQLSTKLLESEFGMGSSCCGDIYYHVGFILSIIIFILFGCFVKKMDLELYSKNHNLFWLAFSSNYLFLAIYLGRGLLTNPINISVYTFLLIYFVSKIKKSNSTPQII